MKSFCSSLGGQLPSYIIHNMSTMSTFYGRGGGWNPKWWLPAIEWSWVDQAHLTAPDVVTIYGPVWDKRWLVVVPRKCGPRKCWGNGIMKFDRFMHDEHWGEDAEGPMKSGVRSGMFRSHILTLAGMIPHSSTPVRVTLHPSAHSWLVRCPLICH